MFIRLALAVCLLAAAPPGARAQTASTWFLAEGANNAIFQQEILIGNPSGNALTVTVTLLPQSDAQVTATQRTYPMNPTSRLTVRPGVEFGLNGSASARVSAVLASDGTTPADIVVERSMYFSGGTRAGGHNAGGVTALAPSWTLAEGASTIFSTFILAANPNATHTDLRATYLTADGQSFVSTQRAEPNSRATFWPQAEHDGLASAEFSSVIESLTDGNDIVAERAMYFDFGPVFARSGHDALGVPAPSTTWVFAEGFTGGNATIAFETFLLLANPGDTATQATVDYLLDSGQVISLTYPLPARERFTIWVDQEGRVKPGAEALANAAFGIRVTADAPIVAERALYWGTPSAADPFTPTFPWSDGHATAGATAAAVRWAFAEGGQDFIDGSSNRYETFLLFSNPNPNPIVVRATFLREDGTGIQRDRCVPGGGRSNIWAAEFPELSNRRFASVVETVATDASGPCGQATGGGEPFVAERAMYWGGFQGGHGNIGTPWTGSVVVPPVPADPLTATFSSVPGNPTQGRLSGGQWVTLDVTNHAIADTEVWFGDRRATEVEFLSATRLRARTPVRTKATGFGSTGPVTVQVRSAGRTFNAGTFTFYFSVLAFGDSITWGTSSLQVGSGNTWQSFTVSSPYPRLVKNALVARFGNHTRVTNAGIPGERAIGDGEIRLPRCLVTDPGPACFAQGESANPDDYTRPFDVVVVLHGINDLFHEQTPQRTRDALRSMVLSAKAADVPVIMTIFSSYKTRPDGTQIPGVDNVPTLNELVLALTVQESLQRIDFGAGIDMSFDGLHPSGLGYQQMAQMVIAKLLDNFPQ